MCQVVIVHRLIIFGLLPKHLHRHELFTRSGISEMEKTGNGSSHHSFTMFKLEHAYKQFDNIKGNTRNKKPSGLLTHAFGALKRRVCGKGICSIFFDVSIERACNEDNISIDFSREFRSERTFTPRLRNIMLSHQSRL